MLVLGGVLVLAPSTLGLTQNRETMAFLMITTVDLFYFIMCEDHMNRKLLR